MNPIKKASLDHQVHELIANRWSPCAFADRHVAMEDLASLFEAARWAPSSYNEQPWRYLVATKDNPNDFARLLSCLEPGNQAWAKTAPVLALGCTATTSAKDGKPNRAAMHDLGLAAGNICLQASALGLFVHQMLGILTDKAREVFHIPDGVDPLTGIAIGYLGDPNAMPENLKKRDLTPRNRKSLREFVFTGEWENEMRF
jgi:nitroreductase